MIKDSELYLFNKCSEYNVFGGNKFWVAYINGKLFHTRSEKSMFYSKEDIIRAMKQSLGRDLKNNYSYYLDDDDEFRNVARTFKTERDRNAYIEKRVSLILDHAIKNNLITFKIV